jgi:hypothetical protein
LPTEKMKVIKPPRSKFPYVDRGSEGHQTQWVQACKKGFGAYTSSSFDVAGPLTETVLMGNLAIRSYNIKDGNNFPGRKKLLWDGANMRITNFEAANLFVKREYRKGWALSL